MSRRRLSVIAALAVCGLAVAGCGFAPLNSVVLPGAVGTGSSGYSIDVEFASVSNLVPNSEVKVDDVTVGTVESIHVLDWHASVHISLLKSVHLPANAVATIGQKSLLGAEYVQLAPPATNPVGRLVAGATIPLSHTGRYPETEEVLAALSMLINGGGLANVQTIVDETNTALHGNVTATRDLLKNLNTFLGTLNTQRQQLVTAITAIDRLATNLATDRTELGTAIDQIAPGLAVLNRQQGSLTTALASLNGLGKIGTKVIANSRVALVTDLHELQPTLNKLVEAGSSVPRSIDIVGTFIVPVKAVPYAVKGDFLNTADTVDVSLPALANTIFPGTPLQTALPELQAALEAGNPLTGPLTSAINGSTGSFNVGGAGTSLVDPIAPTSPSAGAKKHKTTPPAPASSSKPCNLILVLLGGC
jgi:phospholipid/cholesterol/gamma-HCH transport system substrate-binding protein